MSLSVDALILCQSRPETDYDTLETMQLNLNQVVIE